ncbi:MAG: lipoprotein [Burkholderiales bacterium]|nr:lipoprotein [Burkholderiales bacterium]MDE2078631.1 lipoprotein [Burkholderiales bacterium]MDE2431924.1 lipoprotein [Burkholderiales bacterium]
MKYSARILGARSQPSDNPIGLTLLRLGALVVALTSFAALAGCGLKGPLYLPEPGPSPTQAASAASAP